ncbi:hypothetical protein [Pseudoxanthomonas sp. Root630]|uniref:hypothetical protein n=1 Tax=Pseudoxanthomonas sp. Root630 TaxID=1736574 RepID=UPI000AD59764|nr:hypothetical protein [Pseudoxanthomonas sp. Root630]
MRNVALGLAAICLGAGCSSKIETVRLQPGTNKAIDGTSIPGVIYYDPMLVKVTYELTQLTDKDKGFLGSSDDNSCKRVVQKQEVVTLPDYANPRAILHKPSWFSSSEFGVTLNNGLLTSVTSKSTPQTAPILEQLVAVREAGVLNNGIPPCNSGPVISRTERYSIP